MKALSCKRVLVLLSIVVLTSCAPAPDPYPVPEQHVPLTDVEGLDYSGDFVQATQKNADAYFIRDIKASEGTPWRWTLEAPEVRLRLGATHGRKLRIEFAISDTTFRDTGPLRVNIFVNERLFDQVVYDTPGDKLYEKPVPESLLRANAENRLRMRVLNPWQAPDPGVRLGILLLSVGIVAQ